MRARLLRTLGPLALILLLAAPLWAQDPPADPTDERNLVQAARAMPIAQDLRLAADNPVFIIAAAKEAAHG